MVDPGVVDQAEAAEHCAWDRLSLAADEPDLAKRLGLLTAAVEFALRSVTIGCGAWDQAGRPRGAEPQPEPLTAVSGGDA